MKQFIEKIYETGAVKGLSGEVHKLNSAIDPCEGEFLFNIIDNEPKILKTLEVGCAFGLSSLFICAALQGRKNANHTIIDPNQSSRWDSVGVVNLSKAGIYYFNLIEIKSEFALPQLLEKDEGKFDLIFIDGWHTFDHTLLDCFYATRLLRVGGILVIDDIAMPSVNRVVNYLKNYPCYEVFGSVKVKVSKSWKKIILRGLTFPINQKTWAKILAPKLYVRIFADQYTSMIALIKAEEDKRSWDWHVDQF